MKPGALTISLDFELHWGVRDHTSVGDPYRHNLLGVRSAMPQVLDLFDSKQVRATWATVGFLLARNQQELTDHSPQLRPTYSQPSLDPYQQKLGEDENDDPFHFASSLVSQITERESQELGSHTFSHYYCLDPAQTEAQFRDDLKSAVSISETYGTTPKSIVFPRNQHNPRYTSALKDAGFLCYRGNPVSLLYKAEHTESRAKRASRLTDSLFNLSGHNSYDFSDIKRSADDGNMVNVPASFFVRPSKKARRPDARLRMRRLTHAMQYAAQQGRLLHLWWHPHNVGMNTPENIEFLTELLNRYTSLRNKYGMLSLTVTESAEHALQQ